MFDVFGVKPLLLNCLLAFLFFFFSFLIGRFFKESRDKGLSFLVGAIMLISLYAFINTGIKSFFTPILFFTPLLLKVDFSESYYSKIKYAVRKSLSTFLLFVVLLIITLIQFDYFSSEVVVSGYPDFTFFSLVAENLKNHNAESPFNYLINYGYKISSTIYHYFDLYMLAFFSEFNESIFLIYTYLYFPLINTIAVVLLADLLCLKNAESNKVVNYLIAIVAVYAPSYGFYNGDLIDVYSYYMPKIIFSLLSFYLFFQSIKLENFSLLAFCIIVCVLLNILLLAIVMVLMLLVAAYYYIDSRKGGRNAVRFYSRGNGLAIILIILSYIYYFIVLSTAKGEISIISSDSQSFFGNFFSPDYLKSFTERLLGYLSTIKYRYLFLLTSIFVLVTFFKNKEYSSLNKVFILGCLFASVGHLLSALLVFHHESFQLHQLGFELIFLLSSAIAIKLILYKHITSKILGYLSAVYIMLGLFYFDCASILKPAPMYKTSKSFFENTFKKLNENDNILYIKKIDFENWRKNLPYWIYDIGVYKTKANISFLKPLSEGMYKNEIKESYPENWKTLIENSPFNMFCVDNGYYPKSFYDSDFELAILKFIKKYNFDAIILSEEMREPDWFHKLKIRSTILPVNKYDSHRIYFLK